MTQINMLDADAIKITKLFPTPVAAVVVPDHQQLNMQLRDAILTRATQTAGVSHSNEGGWQSAEDFADWSGPAGQSLIAFGQSFVNQLSAVVSPEHGLIEANLQWTFSAWANISTKGHSNSLHGHPGSYWSGVYWVDDGQAASVEEASGEIVFHDPRGLMPTLLSPSVRMKIEGCLSAGLSHKINPTSGTFLIFPSWLLHAVNRYDGQGARISVAFNFAI